MKGKQRSLFETKHEEGYPKSMQGYWLGKYKAFALVDTKEHEDELLTNGYEVITESEE